MTRDSRPQAWMHPDVPQAAVQALVAFRAEVRPQLLAYGHTLPPFRPIFTFDRPRTSAIGAQTWCVVCGLLVVLNCDTVSLTCHLVPWSLAAMAPCAGHRVT